MLKPETLHQLCQASTATLTTQLFRRGFRNLFMQGIRPLAPLRRNLVGPAFTLRYIPAREDLDVIEAYADPEHPQRKAIETVPEGHVLVIDCRGDARAASIGHILVTRLAVRGAAGLVSDGGVRDSAPITAMDFPVFCAGPSAPLGLIAHHAAEFGVGIGCGGVAVFPGDIIVGDADGVVAIPAAIAEEVAADAAAQEAMEEFILKRVAGGAPLPGTYPPSEETRAAYAAWQKTRAHG
ncbi:MAG TPA: ribonuclease activity regulator RraA [Acetobacteraceae bacterium]|jgi:regulator of RNase E activity RraA|nr:ribonuclease activity regulator RraA [Acetobacteraceae bacterium]